MLDSEHCWQTTGPTEGSETNCDALGQVCCREKKVAGSSTNEVVCKPSDACTNFGG